MVPYYSHIHRDLLVLGCPKQEYKLIFNNISALVQPISLSDARKLSMTKKITNLFFFIKFNCMLECYKLTDEVLMDAIKCHNYTKFSSYRRVLTANNFIFKHHECIVKQNKYSENKLFYKRWNQYQVPSILQNIPISNSETISLEFPISDQRYYKLLSKKALNVKKSKNNTPKVTIDEIANITSRNFMELFSNQYKRIEYVGDFGLKDCHINSLLRDSSLALKQDNRFYHVFHSLSKDVRKNLYLGGEHLVEAYDIKNARFQCLNAILPDYIPVREKEKFFWLSTSGKFYEEIQLYLNHDDSLNYTYNDEWFTVNTPERYSREDVKTAVNAYLMKTSRFNVIDRAIDRYFEENFPNIRKFVKRYKTDRVEYVTKSGKTRTKEVRVIYRALNKVESTIMLNICKDLYKKTGILGLTLHDAIYMKESDLLYLNEHNLNIKGMFETYLNAYNFI